LTRQALLSQRRVRGDWHEDTLQSANTLVVNLNSLSQFEEAEKLARETLTFRENLLGEFHPRTITSLYNLALTLESQGELEVAEELTRKVLKRRREVLDSPCHPDILSTMEHLIALLKEEKKDEEADKPQIEANELITRYESDHHLVR
jgi:tetratricopeptide (TPR) repeat protein